MVKFTSDEKDMFDNIMDSLRDDDFKIYGFKTDFISIKCKLDIYTIRDLAQSIGIRLISNAYKKKEHHYCIFSVKNISRDKFFQVEITKDLIEYGKPQGEPDNDLIKKSHKIDIIRKFLIQIRQNKFFNKFDEITKNNKSTMYGDEDVVETEEDIEETEEEKEDIVESLGDRETEFLKEQIKQLMIENAELKKQLEHANKTIEKNFRRK